MSTNRRSMLSSIGRRVGAVTAAGLLCTAVAASASPAAAAPFDAAPPAVPVTVQPPAGSERVATYRVLAGVQIYHCPAGAWTLRAPEALLADVQSPRRKIHHFAGPSWKSLVDGSTITAARVADSPVAGAIPLLLLQVNGHTGDPAGLLADVDYIQRLNTRGGLAPTGACTEGQEQRVRYGADYVFWTAP